MFNLSSIIPVNLIHKPVEQAVTALWLIAIAEFFNFSIINSHAISLEWFLTAPALMLAAIIIAIRVQSIAPFFIVFFTGVSAALVFVDSDLPGVIFSNNRLMQNLKLPLNYYLMVISLFSLLFWLVLSRLLTSDYFATINNHLRAKKSKEQDQITAFKRICFYLAFLTINLCVLLCVLLAFDSTDSYSFQYSLIVFISAMVFLFVSETPGSELLRGVLLPVYMTLFLVFYLNIQAGMTISHLADHQQILLIWAFSLWFFHNFMASIYHRTFPGKKIMTGTWSWYGLFIVVFVTLNQWSDGLNTVSSLIFLISYLFLMLRNTSLPLLSWAIVFLSCGLFITLLLADNSMNLPLLEFWNYGYQYGQELLVFALCLLVFSILWERTINSLFISLGWSSVSFRKPVLVISIVIGLLYLMLNMLIAFGLVTAWFDVMKEGFLIENTAYLVLILFIAIALLFNNKIVANLIHISAIVLLIISWGGNAVVPVYQLFALIYLAWAVLPLIMERINQSVIDLDIIKRESANWNAISFIISLIYVFNAISLHDIDFRTADLFSVLGVLLIGAIILVRYYAKQQIQKQLSTLWCIVSYLLVIGIIVSLRLMIMGTVAVNEIDTIGIFIISFAFYVINQVKTSAIINTHAIAKLLPLTVVLTIPWSVGSLHTSLTLLVLGIFYLIIQGKSRVMQYSAFVFINIAAYLWMPLLSDHTGLLLFYVIPVVISLLFVSYWHQNEMKKELLNKIRLIALSLIYVVVTADIFINETVFVFVLGLLLGLASVIYAISSKTRVFLYAGVSFIIVIILGQLMLLYPEGRLARALILMLLGATITGMMIWFNVKREYLLSQIRVFRADLDTWN